MPKRMDCKAAYQEQVRTSRRQAAMIKRQDRVIGNKTSAIRGIQRRIKEHEK